ncbi:MAG: peptidylprolyl isomerase [Kiritimatiellae bacterium]|jgi:parvulin-like peptidyl-prolyl isomerase|nr:peptidylprolyl isomerase [Kiritimatiellia bacterium]
MENKKITVNGQEIPEDAIQFELERLVRFYSENGVPEAQIKEQLPELVKRASEQAVGTKLLMDEANKRNVDVSEDEIEEELSKVVEQVGGVDAFKAALEQQKIEEAAFREQLKQGRRVDSLIKEAAKSVCDPTEDELKKHYEEHKDDFKKAERVLAQHILISPDGTEDSSKAEARQKIADIRERVKGGKEFADEAAEHSMCPSGKEGGSLGWFGRGMMVPEFDKAVFSMNVGDVSDVVETQFGFHLICKTDAEEACEASYEDSRDKILELIRHSKRGEAVTAFVETLKADAKIEYS